MIEDLERFLNRYGMLDLLLDIDSCASEICAEMERGLSGEKSSLPMIPTYLNTKGSIPDNRYAIVIDAGGTNFRCGLAHFECGSCVVDRIKKAKMPGVEKPVIWKEFLTFVADQIEDLLQFTDLIGFCFSYSAEITPEIDGRVIIIDKEVAISGCEGKLVGRGLTEELDRRGYPGKHVVIVNDTAAVQLGGFAKHLNDGYTSYFGQVSGTGTNTCFTASTF